MANRLLRLDECAADIVIPDESHTHGQSRLFGEADRRADAGIRYRHDDIGIGRLLARQQAPEIGPHFIHAFAEHVAVGTGKIHVLEDALRRRGGREGLERSNT